MALAVSMAACATRPAHPGPEDDIRAAMTRGDIAAVNAYANSVAFKGTPVDSQLLDDWSVIPTPFTLTYPNGEVNHLGVRTVADFVLCLLEVRHHEFTCDLVRRYAPTVRAECPTNTCGVCCTLTGAPFPEAVREVLVEYWKSRLNREEAVVE